MEKAEIVVVGGGIAGLCFALQCAEKYKVQVLCKGLLYQSNTALAQGGIAAALYWPDSVEQHYEDTLKAGNGYCDEKAVAFLTENAGKAIQFLANLGLKFERNAEGTYHLALEGAHSHPRVLHVKDQTGRAITEVLSDAAMKHPNIDIEENAFVERILVANQQAIGVSYFPDKSEYSKIIYSPIIMLATGGIGQLFETTSNHALATADGIALGHAAGTLFRDLDFVQFHPTLLYQKEGAPFLISEALRGAGAVLVNEKGESFLESYHPEGSLAPRDVVSKAIYWEMQKSGQPCVYLDIRSKWNNEKAEHFQAIYQKLIVLGIHPAKDLIPVHPAAHYLCGGIQTDLQARTHIKGLFASGETAGTGVHGSNRLASNSLLEALVFSMSAAEYLLHSDLHLPEDIPPPYSLKLSHEPEWERIISTLRTNLQRAMTERGGIMRTEQNLYELQAWLKREQSAEIFTQKEYLSPGLLELRNMFQAAELLVDAALSRWVKS